MLNDFKKEKIVGSSKTFLPTYNSRNPQDASRCINMVDWLHKYSPEFSALIADERLRELAAEATYWTVKLSLAPLIEKMSYAEIHEFHPLEEMSIFKTTERSALLKQVANEMKAPIWGHEASEALRLAAQAVYVRKHSYEALQEAKVAYEQNHCSQCNQAERGLTEQRRAKL
jgi:hypothetical protein